VTSATELVEAELEVEVEMEPPAMLGMVPADVDMEFVEVMTAAAEVVDIDPAGTGITEAVLATTVVLGVIVVVM
jgi:hypothetical protein